MIPGNYKLAMAVFDQDTNESSLEEDAAEPVF